MKMGMKVMLTNPTLDPTAKRTLEENGCEVTDSGFGPGFDPRKRKHQGGQMDLRRPEVLSHD